MKRFLGMAALGLAFLAGQARTATVPVPHPPRAGLLPLPHRVAVLEGQLELRPIFPPGCITPYMNDPELRRRLPHRLVLRVEGRTWSLVLDGPGLPEVAKGLVGQRVGVVGVVVGNTIHVRDLRPAGPIACHQPLTP